MASSTPWPTEAVNKGALGQTTLLTCWLTLQNGNDSIRVQSLWDSESESSFFNQGLLPFATYQRRIDFKLETLSCVAKKPEVVKGIEASFEVEVQGGNTVQLNLISHHGMEARQLQTKPKLLTCSSSFADKHQLQQTGLTETCPKGQHRYMQPHAQLNITLGVDLGHIQPKLVDSFHDTHGY